MNPLDLLTSGLSWFGTMLGNVLNYVGVGETNQANMKINQNNLDYNAAMTQQQWERDDNAHQREVADLEKAGLSPIAATGGANTSAALGAPAPIAMQAPQVDVNSLINGVLGASKLSEEKRHNRVQEGIQNTQLEQNAEEIELKSKSLELEDKKLKQDYQLQSRAITLQARTLSETIRKNKAEETLKFSQEQREQIAFESKQLFLFVKEKTGREDIPFELISDPKEYANKVELREQAWLELLSRTENLKSSEASGRSTNLGGGGTVAGTGINATSGSSSYTASSKDNSFNAEKEYEEFERKYPYPIFEDDYSNFKNRYKKSEDKR